MLDRTTILRDNARRDVINNGAEFAQRYHTISLYEMRLLSFVGVSDEERSSPQNIILNMDIGIDRSRLGFADKIEHTVDYAEVVKRINEEAAKTRFYLLETLAERICKMIFS
jgi:dihydroneopterin aldolase